MSVGTGSQSWAVYKHVTCFGVLFQCFSNLFPRSDKSSFVGSIFGDVGVHFNVN
jgi:hypothetical protein